MRTSAPGAQTRRRDDGRPVRVLLRGETSPATFVFRPTYSPGRQRRGGTEPIRERRSGGKGSLPRDSAGSIVLKSEGANENVKGLLEATTEDNPRGAQPWHSPADEGIRLADSQQKFDNKDQCRLTIASCQSFFSDF